MKPKAASVTFEKALGWLRAGRAIRRRSWHPESKIFRVGAEVFVRLPDCVPSARPSPRHGGAPAHWLPYPTDVLATDWEQAK